jgi:hypothetical protein
MPAIFIYALVSTRDGGNAVWYVGQSVDVQGRFEKHHLKDAKAGRKKASWIRAELEAGFTVYPRVVEECTTANANEREAFWIEFFARTNAGLTNGTNGTGSAQRRRWLDKVAVEQRAQLESDREWLVQHTAGRS